MRWTAAEPDVGSVLAEHPDPLASLARAEVPAIVLRGAYEAEHCAALIDRFVARGLMAPNLLDADSVQPRRVDIGTSLSNRAADKEGFLAHAQETRELFATLFAGHPDPVKLLYDRLAELSVGKRVTTAYEPGGRSYGPAIFRIHYAGHRYQPHVDHVGKHERRLDYAVGRFAHQFAGVLCMQNSRSGGRIAQSILHRCLWSPELEPCLQADGFADYAAANAIEHYQVDLQPGDIHTGFHERTPVSAPEEAGAYRESQQSAFAVYDANQRRACGPERVGESIVRLVESERPLPPRVTVGSRFQAGVAPLLARLVPTRMLRWGLRRYYRLGG